MKCPVCELEISRVSHIVNSIDLEHKKFVENQKDIGKKLLFSGMVVSKIRHIDEIIIKGAVEGYLYENFKDKIKENASLARKKNISKAMKKDDSKRNQHRKRIQQLIEEGEEHIDYVICQICGLKSSNISSHISRIHKLKATEYKNQFPGYELFSQNLRNGFREKISLSNPNDNPETIKKMKKTKEESKPERIRKAKEQFAKGERKATNNIGRGITGVRLDLGHNCRSMWEANVARILKLEKIDYLFEVKSFPFYKNKEIIGSYLPDFYLPKYNKIIEVKGQMDKVSFEKLALFQQQYPNIKVLLLEDKHYSRLTKKYKDIIGQRWEYSGRNIKTHPSIFK